MICIDYLYNRNFIRRWLPPSPHLPGTICVVMVLSRSVAAVEVQSGLLGEEDRKLMWQCIAQHNRCVCVCVPVILLSAGPAQTMGYLSSLAATKHRMVGHCSTLAAR